MNNLFQFSLGPSEVLIMIGVAFISFILALYFMRSIVSWFLRPIFAPKEAKGEASKGLLFLVLITIFSYFYLNDTKVFTDLFPNSIIAASTQVIEMEEVDISIYIVSAKEFVVARRLAELYSSKGLVNIIQRRDAYDIVFTGSNSGQFRSFEEASDFLYYNNIHGRIIEN